MSRRIHSKCILYVTGCLLGMLNAPCLYAQQPETIKIQKQEPFLKAEFDETNYKVVALDRYGNPHEDAIQSFVITYGEGKNIYEAPVKGNTFPERTIHFFTKKRKTATKVCLIKIVAEDKDGHLQNLPDLCEIVLFPDCKNTQKN